MVTPEMLALLEALGANRSNGNGRTLLDHLEATRALLAAWGRPCEICLAGLFHSAYGAEGGAGRDRSANLVRREEVRAVIGPVAEELAYLYSALQRRSLFAIAARDSGYSVHDVFLNTELPLQETTVRALFEIEAANFVEGPLTRFDRLSDEILGRLRTGWEAAQRFVTPRAYEAVINRFGALAELRPGVGR